MKTIKSIDDIRDIAIAIVDELVSQGLVPNCLDTDDETEFEFQDVITEVLSNKFNIENK